MNAKQDTVPRRKSSRCTRRTSRDMKDALGSDAKALWADVVLDVFSKDRSDARLAKAIETVKSYDTVAFLQALDAMQDALVEDYFKSTTGFADFGREEAFALCERMQLRRCPQALVTLVGYLWELWGSNPTVFLSKAYQIAALPLRIDVGECSFDYGEVLRVNKSRDAYTPSRLLKRIARRVVTEAFVDDVIAGFAPHHGPGSVAFRSKDGKPRTKRLQVRDKDDVLDLRVLESLCLGAGIPVSDQLSDLAAQADFTDWRLCPSKMMDVPKTWKKRRLIAIEDATRMYFAKGVQQGLYFAIHNHRLLNRVINLHDASLNCKAAQFGSLTGSYSTVDLSSASDSVGARFVRELLGEDSRLWRILRHARPTLIDVPGTGVVKNNIFATMGNAVCFPVLTLVVTLILFEAHLICKVRRSSPRVYGDDAICEQQVTDTFIRLLQRYGFKVNERKTFSGSDPYRESCGGEYLRGIDITPLRLSRRFSGLKLGRGFEHFMDLVSLANGLYARKYMRAYRRVCQALSGFGYVPFSTDASIGVRHDFPRSCMSSYPVVNVPGSCDRWVLVQYMYASKPRNSLRGGVGLMEWMYQFARDTKAAESFFARASDPRDAQTVASGVRPEQYHRSRAAFCAEYALLCNWRMVDGFAVIVPIDQNLVIEDERYSWREI